MVSLRGCSAALLVLALRGEAALRWVKAGSAARAMCAGVEEPCSDMASCTKVAVGPCGGVASPPFWLEVSTEGLALVDDDDTSYLSDASKLNELTPTSHSTNKYRHVAENQTARGVATYATVANGAYFGTDPRVSGGYVAMAAHVLQTGSITTNQVDVMYPDGYGQSGYTHEPACISALANSACGPATTFTEGAFKYSYMGASQGSSYSLRAAVRYLGIRSKLAMVNFPSSVTLSINTDKTLATIGTADVTTMTVKETSGQMREMKLDFPLKYNVGSLANLTVPTATRDVKIKVSRVPSDNTSIYVDYLFDASDFQAKDKWFLYDPTATEQVASSTGGGSGTTAAPSGGTTPAQVGTANGAAKTELANIAGAFIAAFAALRQL